MLKRSFDNKETDWDFAIAIVLGVHPSADIQFLLSLDVAKSMPWQITQSL